MYSQTIKAKKHVETFNLRVKMDLSVVFFVNKQKWHI